MGKVMVVHRGPTQAVIKGDCPAVKAYHAVEVRAESAGVETDLLVLAYDDSDTVGSFQAYEQQARKDWFLKCGTEFHPTPMAVLPRGPGFPSRARFREQTHAELFGPRYFDT